MRTRLEFKDGATDIFAKIATISNGLVKEGLQIEASTIAKVYKRVIKSQEKSEWSSFKGKKGRRLTVAERKKRFGAKHSRKTGEPIQGNLSDHVKFYVPKDINKLYAVIGGGHPTFYPIKYKDGVPVGYMGRITATTQETLDILDGINDGKVITVTPKMRKYLSTTVGLDYGGIRADTKKLVVKPRHFAETARSRGARGAVYSIAQRYERNFPKAVANIEVKEVKVTTA